MLCDDFIIELRNATKMSDIIQEEMRQSAETKMQRCETVREKASRAMPKYLPKKM